MNSSNKIKSWLTDWTDNDASVKPLLNNLEDNKHQNKAEVWIENWVKEKSQDITE